MGRIEKTVFISYRRTNFYTALAVYQDLTAHGYDVFFDYQSIDSGNFEKVITENVKYRAHFVLILSSSALERCKEPGDWLRREIELAMDERRNIVPLTMEGFDFGNPNINAILTGKLATLSSYNAMRLHADYFFEGMEKLRTRFLNVALEDLPKYSLSEEVQELNQSNRTAVEDAALVDEKQLTAEEWFERAFVLETEGQYNEAEAAYYKAIELNPLDAASYANLGEMFHFLQRDNEAEAVFRKAIELDSLDATGYSNFGGLLKDIQRYEEAETAFSKSIELDASNFVAYFNLGSLFFELQRFDEAEKAFHKTIELFPSFSIAYFALGELLSNKNLQRYEEAEKAYRKAIEIDPSFDSTYHSLGFILTNLERYDEAETAYRKAIELNPEDITSYYDLGVLLYENLQRFDEAEVTLRKAIEIDPEDAIVYYNLGFLLDEYLHRYSEAETAYRKAIKLDPYFQGAYNNLGLLLLEHQQHYDEAETIFRKAIEINPDVATPYYNLGNLLSYENLRRYGEAEAAYRKAIELDSAIPDYYYALVKLFRFNLVNRLEDTLPLLEKVIKIDTDNFIPYIDIASINKQLDKDFSTDEIRKARQLISEDDWYNRACLESVCNNFDLAFEYLQKATNSDEFNPAWVWEDPDLQWIRYDPRFIDIVGPKPE